MQILGSPFAGGISTSFESITTYTVGSGGQANITFSSIPQTYKHLQVRFFTKSSGGYYNPTIQLNGDTSANYVWHYLDTNGVNVTSGYTASTTSMFLGVVTPDYFATAIVDILDYTSTAKFKTIRTMMGTGTATAGYDDLFSGTWISTSAVTSIQFNSSNTQYSHYALYGIKG